MIGMIGLKKELNGAWEERGVIGTRIEIDGKRITVLWRSAPVLETTFKAQKADGKLELKLKYAGMRYKGTDKDYAEITGLTFADGKLELVENFPITGESRTTLSKTEYNRYGNYDIEDGVLSELTGTWKTDDGYNEITFKDDTMVINGTKTKVHALKPRGEYERGKYIIADADPSVEGWRGFSRLEYFGGIISARMFVCDAPSVDYIFKKQQKHV